MDQIIPAPAPTRTEMGNLSSLTTTQKGSIVEAINEVDADVSALNNKIANFVASNPAFYGVYPNGKNYNRDYFRITVPCWNPEEKTITVTNAYVYSASGAFTDIKSAVTVSAVTRAAFICEITFDATHAGKMLWIEYTIAS